MLLQHGWVSELIEGGAIYWDTANESLATGAAELLRSMVQGEVDPAMLAPLAPGSSSDLLIHDELVFKHFFEDSWAKKPEVSGVPYVAASVALNKGLELVQPHLWLRRRGFTRFQYKAPTMYGAFVPDASSTQRPISVMSLERGEDLGNAELKRPHEGIRYSVYRNALSRVGVSIGEVSLDPTYTNTLLQEIGRGLIQVTRLDIHARANLIE
jgi:hypothetical protein